MRINLSTRPFYNEGAVRLWLLALAAVVAAATIFNVSRVLHYSRNDSELALRASQDERTGAALGATATRERASVDARQIASASNDARLANDLIDRRTFSWTELFNRFEATLPADVRLTSVRPRIDEKSHRIDVVITVIARSVDDENQFMENLRATGAFADVFPNDERVNTDGQLEVAMVAQYMPKASPAAGDTAGTAGTQGQGRP